MKKFARAKINLTLEILGKNRPDMFHDIKSVMHKIDLADEIELEVNDSGNILLDCSDKSLCSMEENIAYVAAKLFCRKYFEKTGKRIGADIFLTKHIPSKAGLGGGSADAAVTIDMLKEQTGDVVTEQECDEICAAVGSDVVFCRQKHECALCTGRGEIVKEIVPLPESRILVAKPTESLSTKGIYSQYDELYGDDYSKNASEQMMLSLEKADLLEICSLCVNDFEKLCIGRLPAIKQLKENMKQCGALVSMMSGSGSAVFGIFDSDTKYSDCKKKLVQAGFEVF